MHVEVSNRVSFWPSHFLVLCDFLSSHSVAVESPFQTQFACRPILDDGLDSQIAGNAPLHSTRRDALPRR